MGPCQRFLASLGAAAVSTTACVPSYEMTDVRPSGRACPDRDAGIAWYFPKAEADNSKLERWCATVGPSVASLTPAADFGSLGSGDSLAIVVWNPDGGSGRFVAFLEEELGFRCNGPSTTLRPAGSHVVLLAQEVLRRSNAIPDVSKRWETLRAVDPGRPDSVLDAVDVARHCGLALLYVPSVRNGWAMRDGKREDKGNAIFSTLPLADPVAVELPLEGARRIMVAATLRSARGDSVRVANVHLETIAGLWRLLRTGNASRLRQAMAILEVLERIEAERDGVAARNGMPLYGIATVLGGDFNVWTTREAGFRRLWEQFPDSPGPLEQGTRGPFPTDHILIRLDGTDGGAVRLVEGSYRRIGAAYASDHRPSIARLKLGQ